LTDEAPPTINSHTADIGMKQMDKGADTDDDAVACGGQSGEPEEPAKKDKSVLQAKLTKLAIQIGYAGELSTKGTLGFHLSYHLDPFQTIALSPLLQDRLSLCSPCSYWSFNFV